ncbi:hypothetical protein [Bacillus cihuensis]|uniref:hypothetical protein n=1 Tax=Bacillus cihuensis TaxID=1208599 RepID=UPI0006876706|nr:hypothetical protein [Bacillus cihuensis]
MIYVKFDAESSTGYSMIHNMPFDEKNGLGKSKEELDQEGVFVDAIPTPDTSNSDKVPVLKYNNGLYYEYEDRQLTPEEKNSVIRN